MLAAGLKQIEYRMSNKEFRMIKLITSIGSFGVRYSLFVLPAMPSKGFPGARQRPWELPLPLHRKFFAWQAGILRFAFELLHNWRGVTA